MNFTITTHLWLRGLGRWIQRLLGLTFDLTGLDIDDEDLDLDLSHGRG